MTPKCEVLVDEMDHLLKEPDKYSFRNSAEAIYEQGYVEGAARARQMLRIILGLAVPADLED